MIIYRVFNRKVTAGIGWDERDEDLDYFDSLAKVKANYPNATDINNNPKTYIPGTNIYSMKIDGLFYEEIHVK